MGCSTCVGAVETKFNFMGLGAAATVGVALFLGRFLFGRFLRRTRLIVFSHLAI